MLVILVFCFVLVILVLIKLVARHCWKGDKEDNNLAFGFKFDSD